MQASRQGRFQEVGQPRLDRLWGGSENIPHGARGFREAVRAGSVERFEENLRGRV